MSRPSWKGRAALLLGASVLVASTMGGAPAGASTTPLPPQSDPFYRPPSGFGSTAPGTILRTREVSAAAFGALPQKVRAWQLLYRTTDTQGAPEATVTTVLEPDAAATTPRPLLSYQVAEDSAAPQCAISYQLQQGAGNANIVAQAEILLIDAGLQHGWAVTVPDYEGPKSAYVAGRQAGQAVLDGIRATENFTPAGLEGTKTNVGIWGYSGGALASGWAAELQPGYAPELNIKGVAVASRPHHAGQHALPRPAGPARPADRPRGHGLGLRRAWAQTASAPGRGCLARLRRDLDQKQARPGERA